MEHGQGGRTSASCAIMHSGQVAVACCIVYHQAVTVACVQSKEAPNSKVYKEAPKFLQPVATRR